MEGERWLICGQTGCGKTTFSKELMFRLMEKKKNSRLYIFNSKFGIDFEKWGHNFITDGSVPRPLKSNERIQIWSPIHVVPNSVDIWLSRILHEGDAILDIDELVHLLYKRKQISQEYEKLAKTGRSKNIDLLSNTQNLVELPPIVISQSTHLVRFRLLNPYERRLSKMLLKIEGKMIEPEKYGFYYANMTDMNEANYYSSYELFMKGLK